MGSMTLTAMMLLAALATGETEKEMSSKPAYEQYAQATCSLSNQQRSGARKICYYTCGDTVRTMVVPVGRTCPFTIRR
ncbi:hypothetical protein [Parvibaculum sp.]|jgi:hypothetical protein|uniref:hypothetical protein n=1 Tax=Parvibaculum sp. TaxID=2024848 RepID=UPI000C3E191A|nr:hypothetical protein [Parvibaculum sp.]HAC58729.1 hypothetical protein [Rhodobiaceae bacterium]MAU61982.1 hypothetical protein [Parvibaculum sp.]MBO6666874.1 hypothetical protein [Parvibaculum sp.]MBO6691921.1 hypothetical protein [Parvibaculum sp.]MBO6713495.1 hypothetical protein [Parvibaculum sp.]|tara:strand:+ start:137 stop:370 length:234 start_codon:yes stop_codon:yes gene_type:complete